MAQLAIKAHPTRTKEVIEILEMLGGKNRYHFKGDEDEWFVLNGNIQRSDRLFAEKGFTLEDFLEKYPYKVGDKVNYVKYNDEHSNVYTIQGMQWTGVTIEYLLDSSGFSALTKDLQPYEEETMCGELTCNETMCLKVASLKPEKGQIVFGADSPNETELVLGDNFEIKEGHGRAYVVRKQSKYPSTYEECCKVLGVDSAINDNRGYRWELLCQFQELLINRDAYWRIAGDWEPDWKNDEDGCNVVKFCIKNFDAEIVRIETLESNTILAFPTKEMRDAFYENFKELIELVKELL